jgi:hypothetical protein
MDINIDQSKELILTAAKASCHSCLSCHTSTEKSPVSKKMERTLVNTSYSSKVL